MLQGLMMVALQAQRISNAGICYGGSAAAPGEELHKAFGA